MENDSISRQAAIDAFDGVKVGEEYCTEYDIGFNDGIDLAISKLSVLPSAQPEILACGEGELNVTDTNVGDIISRKAAVYAAIKADMKNNNGILSEKRARAFDEYISNLPSVHPERKKGEWVVDDEFVDCSVCRREKWSRIPYGDLVRRFRYCPNCGAEMRRDG